MQRLTGTPSKYFHPLATFRKYAGTIWGLCSGNHFQHTFSLKSFQYIAINPYKLHYHLFNCGIVLKVCIRETFLYDSKIWPATAKNTRGYFRKIKRLGIGYFVKKFPFLKKTFSYFEKCQKQLLMRGYSIYTCCS